jgi:23S rRNA (cytosine1962-C5)-methyltransferase
MIEKIKKADKPNVLNLFAYTGGASVAAAYAGAKVCHVDAAKGMVELAKENMKLSGLEDYPVRFIVDDVIKFVKREARRGNKYDGIIMDPPVYGHGPNGETWSIEKDLYNLIELCLDVLSDKPLFFLISSYTAGLSPIALNNVLTVAMGKRFGGIITSDEIGLPIKKSGLILPCGVSGRWERNDE